MAVNQGNEDQVVLQQALMEVRNENAALLREVITLQRRINELGQDAARFQAEAANANRELAEIRRQLEEVTGRLQNTENHNRQLNQEVISLREEQLRWFKPLSVALHQPISTNSPDSPDFARCVSQWNGVVELTDKGTYSSEAIPLTCDDPWELRGWFQFTGRPDMVHYLGLDCYTDIHGRTENQITARSVNRVAGTDGVLAEPYKAGDRRLKVKGDTVANWAGKLTVWPPTGRNTQVVAFGPDVLPNFNLSGSVHKCQMRENILEVELVDGINRNWTAGTPVRMHTGGGVYVYGHNTVIANTWQEIVMTHTTHRLRPGTNSVKIVVLGCASLKANTQIPPPQGAATGSSLRIRNLRWEKLPHR